MYIDDDSFEANDFLKRKTVEKYLKTNLVAVCHSDSCAHRKTGTDHKGKQVIDAKRGQLFCHHCGSALVWSRLKGDFAHGVNQHVKHRADKK